MHNVDFLIAGVQKAGTSAACHYLRQNPALCFANRVKEVHFFDRDFHFAGQNIDYDWYSQQFPAKKGRLTGEATPIYFYWAPVAERVFRYNPKMKWIVILRNPAMRAYSHWNMEFGLGSELLPFREAIAAELAMRESDPTFQSRARSYLDRGRYAMQIERLLKWFEPAQLLFVKYEDFRKEPECELGRICNFLEVEPMPPIERQQVHQVNITYRETLSQGDWAYLRDHFDSEITALESSLGWDCTDWRHYESC